MVGGGLGSWLMLLLWQLVRGGRGWIRTNDVRIKYPVLYLTPDELAPVDSSLSYPAVCDGLAAAAAV